MRLAPNCLENTGPHFSLNCPHDERKGTPPDPTEVAGGQLISELKTKIEADLQRAVFEASKCLHKNAADGEVTEALQASPSGAWPGPQRISER
jgi:hypothetical protein